MQETGAFPTELLKEMCTFRPSHYLKIESSLLRKYFLIFTFSSRGYAVGRRRHAGFTYRGNGPQELFSYVNTPKFSFRRHLDSGCVLMLGCRMASDVAVLQVCEEQIPQESNTCGEPSWRQLSDLGNH
jgi:hypothetical protein